MRYETPPKKGVSSRFNEDAQNGVGLMHSLEKQLTGGTRYMNNSTATNNQHLFGSGILINKLADSSKKAEQSCSLFNLPSNYNQNSHSSPR